MKKSPLFSSKLKEELKEPMESLDAICQNIIHDRVAPFLHSTCHFYVPDKSTLLFIYTPYATTLFLPVVLLGLVTACIFLRQNNMVLCQKSHAMIASIVPECFGLQFDCCLG